MLRPKLLTTLKAYSWTQFQSDTIAGIVVGVLALPLAIAFAIASGVSPERGLFTAIVAGFVISAFGGSRVQIGGPTGAFVVIVYTVVHRYGLNGLAIATLMAGAILMIMGFLGFGSAVKFIPYPIIVGFTSGIAVIIFSSQVKDFLGLHILSVPADFWEKWGAYFRNLHTWNPSTFFLSVFSLGVIFFWDKVAKKMGRFRIPSPLVALVAGTLLAYFLDLPVETIGSRYGAVPHTLPNPRVPHFDLATVRELFPVSLTIALLAGIESLLSAVVADGMIGGMHRPNMELVAQGIANILSPLFGGIPATGAIARTAANIKSGGRTPVAGLVHVATLFVIMMCMSRWIAFVPIACLAAILVMIAYHMSEWKTFRMLLTSPKSDVAVLLITFFLTIAVDLTVAIQTGVLLSAFLFIRRMAIVTNVEVVTREFRDEEEKEDPNAIVKREVPAGIEVYEVNGPFFFGASYKFMEAMRVFGRKPQVRIVRMRHVPAMDATGLHVLRQAFRESERQKTAFILSDVHTQPLFALERSGLLEQIGEDHVFGNIDDALNRAREILGLPKVPRPEPFVPTVKREQS
ncbi:MAG: SulP family inorganic anion transporter [Candidatus Omnitrophota bacterium]